MDASEVSIEELKRGGMVPLREKDMFSIWVKTDCCNLSAKQLRKIADITDKYARGFLLFSSRQIPIIESTGTIYRTCNSQCSGCRA